jgi:histidyl-tRNA synthetase
MTNSTNKTLKTMNTPTKTEKLNYELPSGFGEFLPGAKRLEKSILHTITEVYERYGFTPIETPAVEWMKVLTAKDQQGDNIIYTIAPNLPEEGNDSGDQATRGLKFDQTVPLSAYVARHLNDLTFPFARYQTDMVFRGERPKAGRFRQFRQCDIDVVGRNKLSLFYDAQMPAIIAEIFDKLNIGDFLIRINNRKILIGFFTAMGLAEAIVKSCINIVDTMEKIGELGVQRELEQLGINKVQASSIISFTNISGSVDEVLTQLRAKASEMGDPEQFCLGIAELQTVINGIRVLAVPVHRYCIDLSIARGLAYYTGTVYETTLTSHKELGSICSGGRYEELVGTFVGEKMPGVGISIGLTRLMDTLLKEGKLLPLAASPAQVMVGNLDSSLMDTYLSLSQQLRRANVNVLTSFEERPVSKHFAQAERLGIPLFIRIDQSDVSANMARLKLFPTGEERPVALDQLVTEIQQELSHSSV